MHGPNEDPQRSSFWESLSDLESQWNGPWCLELDRGDFNMMRFPLKKKKEKGKIIFPAVWSSFLFRRKCAETNKHLGYDF